MHTVPTVIGDLLLLAILGLTTALVVMVGMMPQSGHSRAYASINIYGGSGDSLRSLTTNAKEPPKAKAGKGQKLPTITAARPIVQGPPVVACAGKTVMNIVAHEDDDLLFINPDISHDLARHDCVRTVYITAGDDGRGANYLQRREAGSRAAYNVMLHAAGPWDYQQISLSSGTPITAANPQNNPNVSLLFLRLPDGNLGGDGFPATDYQSITKLRSGAISDITSVDGSQTYNSSQLVDTLVALMEQYHPVRINTQAQDDNPIVADHSDHITTSAYTAQAAAVYTAQAHTQVTVHYFMGYPIRAMLANLPKADIAQKSAAFFAYAVNDPGVCTSMQLCSSTRSSYGLYLERQYVGID